MSAMSWTMNGNENSLRTAMIDEARALLSIIDQAQADEEIDEDPAFRETRLIMRRMAGRLVAEIVAELRPATVVSKTQYQGQFVGRLVWA